MIAYKALLNKQKSFFDTHQTKEYEFRINQLKKLKSVLLEQENIIYTALLKDLKKNAFESYTTEFGVIISEIDFFLKNLKSLMKPKSVSTSLVHFWSTSKIISEPFGNTLIISPWNYPFQLVFSPLIAAIASGNTAIIKYSEISEHTSSLCHNIITQTFDDAYITGVLGDAVVTQELLNLKFDFIFFTGSTAVGKIIYQKAALHLTPVVLELGGKTPCIVHADSSLDLTAKRIVWGKFTNCGQTCIAPDYIFVHQSVKKQLTEKIIFYIEQSFGKKPFESDSYGKIISQKHTERLISLLEHCKIIYSGEQSIENQYLSPTIVENCIDKPIMEEEIFGPILPILEYQNIEEVVDYINANPKPLALYLFTKDKKIQNTVLNNTSSGGVTINDTLLHFANSNLPFGGVGASGIGKYHGIYSFDAFSNKKGVLKHSFIYDFKQKYPPYNTKLLHLLKFFFKYFMH